MNTAISSILTFLSDTKARIFLSLILVALLASCNLRENALLPPNLDPKLYIENSEINIYMDHLIRSDNDNSFLYIKKESIADNALWYGDVLRFGKVTALTQRDSLAFAESNAALTHAYRISVLRGGSEIILDSIPDFATIYTDLINNEHLADAHLVKNTYQLSAERVAVYPYGSGRCFFAVSGNGDLELQIPGETGNLSIDDNNCAVEALIFDDHERISLWFPQAYMASVQRIDLSIENNLGGEDVTAVQTLFPGFALNTKVLALQTQAPAPENDPVIVHYSMPESRNFNQQWICVGASGISSWDSGENTWLVQDGTLISFLNKSGRYCLITPLSDQQGLNIPLDGSFGSIFLQDIWFDFRNMAMPNLNLKVNLLPSVSAITHDYFNGSPFALANPWQAFHFEFSQSGTTIESLPNDAWIEFGFRNRHSLASQARLFRIFRNQTTDHLDYKSFGTDYDASHYSVSSDFVYSGINSSGTYLFGNASESPIATSIPHLKPNAIIQYAKGFVSWQDSDTAFSSVLLEHKAPIAQQHPWLSGQPYTLGSTVSMLKISAVSEKRERNSLPANLFLSYAHQSGTQSIVNFAPDFQFPRFVRYRVSNTLEHNTFRYVNGKLEISPAFPGYLIQGQGFDAPSIFNLRMFAKMEFDDFDWEVHLDSSQPLGENRVLRIKRETRLPDTYSVLANQYQLSPLSDAYSFYIEFPDLFFANHNPFIRIKQSARNENLLFSEVQGEYYRIYSYPQAVDPDPWHFSSADGHISFLLSSNGFYRVMIDSNPHLFVNTVINTNIRDHIVSLYQAQMNVPANLIGNPLPLFSRINMIRIPDYQAPITPLNAYRIEFRNPAGVMIAPNFYDLPSDADLPFVYIPIPDFVPAQDYRLFFKDINGSLTEFVHVPAFTDEPIYEFIMIGNCAVCLVDNPGVFYITE
ncbi:MAG: hypothetical protein Q8J62_08475 [Candidatus Cloacimonadaceae bacterium]|nr:hypothetical protein [Candidatus Cloacimonadaceae bacterium]